MINFACIVDIPCSGLPQVLQYQQVLTEQLDVPACAIRTETALEMNSFAVQVGAPNMQVAQMLVDNLFARS